MKSKIINAVEDVPNIITFDGEQYDLKMGMWSRLRLAEHFEGGYSEMLGKIEKVEVLMVVVATLINEAIVVKNYRNGTDLKSVTADYVAAMLTESEMPSIVNAVGKALFGNGFGSKEASEQAELDAEIDAELDEIPDETEKN